MKYDDPSMKPPVAFPTTGYFEWIRLFASLSMIHCIDLRLWP